VTFHVIGGGSAAATLAAPNIRTYDEMRFSDTIPYLLHADFGIAPYNAERVAPYLVDTSMKLMQYGALGLPAVCPTVVAGDKTGRFGYQPGDAGSIADAVRGALALGRYQGEVPLNWRQVTDRILDPLQG
jgi:2-beta-glucuronyltransferase